MYLPCTSHAPPQANSSPNVCMPLTHDRACQLDNSKPVAKGSAVNTFKRLNKFHFRWRMRQMRDCQALRADMSLATLACMASGTWQPCIILGLHAAQRSADPHVHMLY